MARKASCAFRTKLWLIRHHPPKQEQMTYEMLISFEPWLIMYILILALARAEKISAACGMSASSA